MDQNPSLPAELRATCWRSTWVLADQRAGTWVPGCDRQGPDVESIARLLERV